MSTDTMRATGETYDPAVTGNGAYKPLGIEAFQKACDLVAEFILKIRDELVKLINGVNAFMKAAADKLNKSIAGRIVEAFTGDIEEDLEKLQKITVKVRDELTDMLNKAADAVHGSVMVASLFYRGFEMTDTVIRPLTGMQSDLGGSGDIDFWHGPAKDTYEKRVVSQEDAVSSTADKVKKLASWLGEAGAGNMSYMSSLGNRLGEIYGSLVTACIDLAETAAGAITQAVALLMHFSEVIGTAASQIVGYVSDLGARITDVLSKILDLEVEKADLRGLNADGSWPGPVSA